MYFPSVYGILPAEMQRTMDLLFADLHNNCRTYIDDIVLFTNGVEEHIQLLEELFRRCVDGGVFLKLAKCHLLQEEVKILGHIVSEHGVTPDMAKVDAIRSARSPTSKAELRSVLGSLSYLRRFVPNFAAKSAFMSDLLQKHELWTWTRAHEVELRSLIEELADQVLLSVPTPDGQIIIITDASDWALGAVLAQLQHGDLVILEFASRKLSGPERNWATREKEAMAIKWAVSHWHHYVLGRPVFVFTDHASLKWMENAQTGKLHRWTMVLQQYDLRIHHLDGELNVIADWLSRSKAQDDASLDSDIDLLSPCFAVELSLQSGFWTTPTSHHRRADRRVKVSPA